MKHKIVINTTTLKIGGALQVAYSIVNELILIKSNHHFLILCSPEFFEQLKNLQFPDNFSYKLINTSPAKFFTRRAITRQLNEIVSDFEAEVVLTVFGPSYWRPEVRHICGFADGWCYYPKTIAYSRLNIIDKFKRKLLSKYKLHHLKREVDFLFIETDDAKERLIDILNYDASKIVTINNTYSNIYNSSNISGPSILEDRTEGEMRFLLLSANYPHKNISILNQVIPLLKDKIHCFKFILTIPPDEINSLISPQNMNWITNVGPVNVSDCLKLYNESDFLFLPTLLETFTATYPEAMKMRKLILTSNLSFAKDICADAAIYFNPLDPHEIVNKIVGVVNNSNNINEIVKEGCNRVQLFPTASERAASLLQLCININKK